LAGIKAQMVLKTGTSLETMKIFQIDAGSVANDKSQDETLPRKDKPGGTKLSWSQMPPENVIFA